MHISLSDTLFEWRTLLADATAGTFQAADDTTLQRWLDATADPKVFPAGTRNVARIRRQMILGEAARRGLELNR